MEARMPKVRCPQCRELVDLVPKTGIDNGVSAIQVIFECPECGFLMHPEHLREMTRGDWARAAENASARLA